MMVGAAGWRMIVFGPRKAFYGIRSVMTGDEHRSYIEKLHNIL